MIVFGCTSPWAEAAITGIAMPNIEASIANMTSIGKNILVLFFIFPPWFLLLFLCIPYFC